MPDWSSRPRHRHRRTGRRAVRRARRIGRCGPGVGASCDLLTFAHQLVGPLAVDLDRADRRRPLRDLTAQGVTAASICIVGDLSGRDRLQHFAFGVLGRWWSGPAGWSPRTTSSWPSAGRGSWWPARCRRPARRWPSGPGAGVADLAGAEDPPAAAHHVVTGHAGRLVDDDNAGTTGARVTARSPSAPAHRPPTSGRPASCSGGPERAAGSIRIRDTNVPEIPVVVDVEGDVGVLETQPALASAGTTPCTSPPWRRTGFGPSAARPAVACSLVALGRQADGVEHPVGQHAVRLGVDTHRADLAESGPTTAPRYPWQWVRLPTTPSGQHGSPLSPLRIGTGGSSELLQRHPRAVPHGDELVAPLGHRLGDQRLFLGQRREFRRVVVHLSGGEACAPSGSTPQSSVAHHASTAWPGCAAATSPTAPSSPG